MPQDYAKIRRQLVRQSLASSQIVYPGAKDDWANELRWVKIKGSGGPQRLTTSALIEAATEGMDPEPALLTAVVLVPRNRAGFFKSDAGWDATPKKFKTEYAKARASFQGTDPRIPELDGDFQKMLALLTKAIHLVVPESTDASQLGGVIDAKSVAKEISLKLVHHLFEVSPFVCRPIPILMLLHQRSRNPSLTRSLRTRTGR